MKKRQKSSVLQMARVDRKHAPRKGEIHDLLRAYREGAVFDRPLIGYGIVKWCGAEVKIIEGSLSSAFVGLAIFLKFSSIADVRREFIGA